MNAETMKYCTVVRCMGNPVRALGPMMFCRHHLSIILVESLDTPLEFYDGTDEDGSATIIFDPMAVKINCNFNEENENYYIMLTYKHFRVNGEGESYELLLRELMIDLEDQVRSHRI